MIAIDSLIKFEQLFAVIVLIIILVGFVETNDSVLCWLITVVDVIAPLKE